MTYLNFTMWRSQDKIIKSQNMKRFHKKSEHFFQQCESRKIDYDEVYDFLEGWCAFANNADTYNFRCKLVEYKNKRFPSPISSKEVNRLIKFSKPKKQHIKRYFLITS